MNEAFFFLFSYSHISQQNVGDSKILNLVKEEWNGSSFFSILFCVSRSRDFKCYRRIEKWLLVSNGEWNSLFKSACSPKRKWFPLNK